MSFPDTKLAKLDTEMPEYDAKDETYYFDHDPDIFAAILNMYRLNELHCPKHICAILVRRELKFWNISEDRMSKCCWKTFYEADKDIEVLDALSDSSEADTMYNGRDKNSLRDRIWVFLDDPSSSRAAQVSYKPTAHQTEV